MPADAGRGVPRAFCLATLFEHQAEEWSVSIDTHSSNPRPASTQRHNRKTINTLSPEPLNPVSGLPSRDGAACSSPQALDHAYQGILLIRSLATLSAASQRKLPTRSPGLEHQARSKSELWKFQTCHSRWSEHGPQQDRASARPMKGLPLQACRRRCPAPSQGGREPRNAEGLRRTSATARTAARDTRVMGTQGAGRHAQMGIKRRQAMRRPESGRRRSRRRSQLQKA